MNWIDITIVIILAVFTLMGVYRGLIKQVFSIAALIGGIAVGFILYDIAAGLFMNMGLVENESIANVGGFIIIGFLAYTVIQILGWITAKLIGTMQLSWLNKATGGALGFVMGAVVSFLLISGLGMYYPEEDSAVEQSVLVPYLDEAYQVVKTSLPEDLYQSILRAKELIREKGLKAASKIEESQEKEGE